MEVYNNASRKDYWNAHAKIERKRYPKVCAGLLNRKAGGVEGRMADDFLFKFL